MTAHNTHASIARGSFEHAFADSLVLGFQRALGSERALVLINYGAATLTLAPQSVRVFDLRR